MTLFSLASTFFSLSFFLSVKVCETTVNTAQPFFSKIKKAETLVHRNATYSRDATSTPNGFNHTVFLFCRLCTHAHTHTRRLSELQRQTISLSRSRKPNVELRFSKARHVAWSLCSQQGQNQQTRQQNQNTLYSPGAANEQVLVCSSLAGDTGAETTVTQHSLSVPWYSNHGGESQQAMQWYTRQRKVNRTIFERKPLATNAGIFKLPLSRCPSP